MVEVLQGYVKLCGSCSGNKFIHSKDDEFSEFRRRVPIYCGDWDLDVEVFPRKTESTNASEDGCVMWEDFCLNSTKNKQKIENATEGDFWIGKRPADLLWHVSNFGDLYWSWVDASPGINGVYGVDENTGKEFLPRIWEDLDPDAGIEEVQQAKLSALAKLNSFPNRLQGGIHKHEMAAKIETDCELLEALIQKRGAFGACALPDALEPIVSAKILNDDGNERHVLCATKSYCYNMQFGTS